MTLNAAFAFTAAAAQFPANKISVVLFVRTDCPITNRYAPELVRLAQRFSHERTPVEFFLIYPDRAETSESVAAHVATYHLPGRVLPDPQHELARRAHATIAPEAAVFDTGGALRYHGRIDDRYISVGRSRPGGAETHDLEDAIAAVEAGKPVQQAATKAFGCFLSDVQ